MWVQHEVLKRSKAVANQSARAIRGNPSTAASAEAPPLFQTEEVPPFAFGEFLVKVLGLGKQI
jgi:hypothetical protein